MTNNHPYRAILPPVPEEIERPLWSVMIPAYNCGKYLAETLNSVLQQDLGSELMQIEVIDDCSPAEDLRTLVAEVGKGRVGFYQQPTNVGHIKNFQTCLERSHGHLIHILHGDDYVRPGFYHKLQKAFDQNSAIGAAFCRQILMNEQGHWQSLTWLEQSESGLLDNWLERIAVEQRIQTPAMVVRRSVYEKLGTFDRRLSWCEDWEMWIRIASQYLVWFEVEPLAVYRMHDHSSSGYKMQTGENIQDIRRAINIFQDYLPAHRRDQLIKKARENWALEAICYYGKAMLAKGNLSATMMQIREAWQCSTSPLVILHTLLLLGRVAIVWCQKIMPIMKIRRSNSG